MRAKVCSCECSAPFRAEQKRWLEFMIEMIVMEATPATLKAAQAEVARLEGRIGQLTPKTYQP